MTKYLLAMLFIIASNISFSQSFQVDKVTGAGSFGVPLFSVSGRNISQGVSLVYSATAVPVGSMSGEVGQNWSIVTGGEIRRTVRGYPDDLISKGWLDCNNPTLIQQHNFYSNTDTNCAEAQSEFTFINSVKLKDTAPDLYNFSFSGFSGSFTFDNSGSLDSIVLIPYQDVKIKAIRNATTKTIENFIITGSNGTTYTFDLKNFESSSLNPPVENLYYENDNDLQKEEYLKDNYQFVSTWKLTKIKNSLNETISFYYKVYDQSYSSIYQPFTFIHSLNSPTNPSTINNFENRSIYTTVNTKQYVVIDSIASRFSSIVFNYVGTEFTTSNHLLKSIVNKIKGENGSTVKEETVLLEYGFVSKDKIFYRPFLKELTFINGCELKQPFRFSYNDVNFVSGYTDLPSPASASIDLWGHYNGINSGTKIPKLFVYPDLNGIKRISPFKILNQTSEIELAGADKNSTDKNQVGVLKEIQYPLGAITSIYYESNVFFNHITNQIYSGAGIRVKKIKIVDPIGYSRPLEVSYKYETSSGQSSGILVNLPVYFKLVNAYRTMKPNSSVLPIVYNSSYHSFGNVLSSEPLLNQYYKTIVRFENDLNTSGLNSVYYNSVKQYVDTLKGYTQYFFNIPYKYGDETSVGSRQFFKTSLAMSTCVSTSLLRFPFVPGQQIIDDYKSGVGLINKIKTFRENETQPTSIITYNYAEKMYKSKTVKGFLFEYGLRDKSLIYFTPFQVPANKSLLMVSSVDSVRDFNSISGNYMIQRVDYDYANFGPYIKKEITTKSDGTKILTSYLYAGELNPIANGSTDSFYQAISHLKNMNMGSVELEKSEYEVFNVSTNICLSSQLTQFKNFGSELNPIVLPEKSFIVLYPDGNSNFKQIEIKNVAGVLKPDFSPDYQIVETYFYDSNFKLNSVLNKNNKSISYHRDKFFDETILSVADAKPSEIIYSNFDNVTDYSFTSVGFTAIDKSFKGKTGRYAISGFGNLNKKLTKSLLKKANVNYFLSGYYKSITPSCNQIKFEVKTQAGATLLSKNITIPNANNINWVYFSDTLNIKSLQNDLVVEVSGVTACNFALDDLTLAPLNHQFSRTVQDLVNGQSAAIDLDGRSSTVVFDNASRIRAIRNFNEDIVKKYTYSNIVLPGSSPIGILVPDLVYENSPITAKALLNCLPYDSIQWKFGATATHFISGNEIYTYQQGISVGINYITIKIYHSSYGSMEYTKTLVVLPLPLQVSISVAPEQGGNGGGSISINRCNPDQQFILPQIDISVSSVDPGMQYFYEWCLPGAYEQWYQLGEMPYFPFELRVVAVASDGRVGISNTLGFGIYCEPPPGDGGTPIDNGN
ncbi:MAG: hypothetical protein O9340_07895 [Cyclobacteriaceae bacterium]|nr:hypothetical protein [Cyclobacteriaceae bacterium]